MKNKILGFDIEINEKVQELFNQHKLGSRFHNPLNIKAFKQYLKGHLEEEMNIKFIEDGFPLWLKTDGTDEIPTNLSQKPASFCTSREEFLKIIKQCIKELKAGQIVPSKTPPKYVIIVFCVPKKDGETGKMTKLRVVRHGSYSTANTTSINQWIKKEKCKMPTLPNLKKYINLLIKCNWMTLRDLKDAFRQIGLSSADEEYLGYSICGLYLIDKKQPYGIASAAANCQSFAQLLVWIMNNKLLPKEARDKILVHIDDFILAAKDKETAILMKNKFDGLCDELNVIISHEKDVDVTQEAVLYGFRFNLKKKTVGIPEDKLEHMKKLINNTLKAGIISGVALESLCGKIMHWSQLYKPAKSLCYNMLSYLFELIRKKHDYKKKCFYVPQCIKQDLKFWLKYIEVIREVKMEYIIKPPSLTVVGTSDASDEGAGFCINRYWGFYEFKEPQKSWHINQKEAHAVITMIQNLKDYLTGKKLILLVDNTALFYSMAKHWGSKAMMPCIYEICYLMMEYKIEIWFDWIPTECNKLADSLSRLDLPTFWKWVGLHGIKVTPIPLDLTYCPSLTYLSPQL